MANIGDDPTLMLNAPVPAARKVLAKAGLSVDDIDLWEINEAFAVVSEKFIRDLGLDRSKVNVNGGSIALGHPIGATGAILIGTVLDELERTGGRYGLVTMCAGGRYGAGDHHRTVRRGVSETPIRLAVAEGVATITLDRPGAGNAMDMAFMDALHVIGSMISDDNSVRSILIEANGRNFCVGGDMRDFGGDDPDGGYMHRLAGRLHEALKLLAAQRAPIVLAVQGGGGGGGAEPRGAGRHRHCRAVSEFRHGLCRDRPDRRWRRDLAAAARHRSCAVRKRWR